MDQKVGRQHILQAIASGNLNQAVELFLCLAEASKINSLQNDATMLSGRYARLQRDTQGGVLTREDSRIEESRIMSALTAYAQQLPEGLEGNFRGIFIPGRGPEPIVDAPPVNPTLPKGSSGLKKILFLGANPDQTTQLRINQELRDIENGLERATHRDRFELKAKWAVRPSDLRRALLDESPQIVHFSGHGAGEAGIILEDEQGQPKLVSSIALGNLFGLFAEHIECVLLNACYSETQAKEIVKYIPFVIGMNRAVPDATAIEFAVAFYDALASGKDYPFAYRYARSAIELQGLSGEMIPVLKQRRV
ncbi:MAG: CHAT domain-containing protein [Saprospiraceae bacterium]